MNTLQEQRDDLLTVLSLIVDTGFPVTDEYGGEHWAISETIREQARRAIATAKRTPYRKADTGRGAV